VNELVVDTSAAVAVLTGEPVGGEVMAALDGAERLIMSAAGAVELGIVLEARYGPVGAAVLERFLRAGDIEVVPFDREQADLAIDGWRRFGKGRHPAALNLGDCLVYGLAMSRGAGVVCTGDDFGRTDLEPVFSPGFVPHGVG
jgi:ribonuclease VapC